MHEGFLHGCRRHWDAAAAVADAEDEEEEDEEEEGGAGRRRWPGSYWKSSSRLLLDGCAQRCPPSLPGPQKASAGDFKDTITKKMSARRAHCTSQLLCAPPNWSLVWMDSTERQTTQAAERL